MLLAAALTIGCAAKSVHTTLDAKAAIHEEMEIDEVTAWAGVKPSRGVTYGGQRGPLVMHALCYKLKDGKLCVSERPDGTHRVEEILIRP
jgi:hypothetical protein